MRVFCPIVGPVAVNMFGAESQVSKGWRIGPQLVRHDLGWRETLFLEQFLRQPLSGFRIAPALNQEVQNLALIVDRPPEPIAPPANDQDDFIKVPEVARSWSSAMEVGGYLQAEL